MYQNNIRELRKGRGLTQRALAASVGTSQQQIQRIESGTQTVRFDLAAAIAAALEAPLEKAFPSAEKLFSSMSKRKSRTPAWEDETLEEDADMSGVDLDPHVWTLKYLLRGGHEGQWPISSQDKRRLFRIVQDPGTKRFAVFDTPTHRVAINTRHLSFSQFLFDAAWPTDERGKEEGEIEVHMISRTEPLTFTPEPDREDLAENPEAEEGGELQELFFTLEGAPEDDETVGFTDVDGEMAFFRVGDIAMVSVPLWAVEPAIWEAEMVGHDEEMDVRKETK